MSARLIGSEDSEWSAVLDRTPHDVYQLPGYARVEADRAGGDPRALLVTEGEEFFLQPLVLRPIPADLARAGERDAISPYGYAGPLISPGWSDAGLNDALDAGLATLAEAAVCCAFIQLNPLQDYPLEALARHGEIATRGQTVWCDLTRSDDDAIAAMRPDARSRLRRAASDRLSASIDDWETYPDFQRLYAATMDRVDAADWYKFSADYFDDLRDALPGVLHLCTIRDADDSTVASGLFTACGDTVQYHLSGRSDGSGPAAMRLLVDTMRTWAKASGYQRLHLGSGLGGREDSLFEFKAGFSPNRGVLRSWAVVSDPVSYARLTEGIDNSGGFFPAYRANSQTG